jgi:branched-chain amino acid transport system permease protein
LSLALQILVSGLGAGAVYGLVAIGYSLFYRLTGIVYFAFGDLVGLGVFAALLVAAGTGPVSQTSVGAGRFLLALAVGLAVCTLVSAAGYLIAVHPHLVRGSTIGWVAATVALAYAVRSAIDVFFTRPSYVFPDPLPFRDIGRAGYVTVGGASIQVRAFFVLAVGVALAVAAGWVVERTKFGRGLQAIASDSQGAAIVGMPVDLLVTVAFGLAGGLAALAAVVAAPSATFATDAGGLLGVNALVAALIARFGSPWTSFAAGLGVGVAEAAIANAHVGGAQLGPEYREVLPIAFALVLVAVRSWRTASTAAEQL